MNTSTLAQLTARVVRHRDDRLWAQFHTAKELAISLSVEAGELLALMQWKTGDELTQQLVVRNEQVRDELADCLHSLLLLAEHLKIDLGEALLPSALKSPRTPPRHRYAADPGPLQAAWPRADNSPTVRAGNRLSGSATCAATAGPVRPSPGPRRTPPWAATEAGPGRRCSRRRCHIPVSRSPRR